MVWVHVLPSTGLWLCQICHQMNCMHRLCVTGSVHETLWTITLTTRWQCDLEVQVCVQQRNLFLNFNDGQHYKSSLIFLQSFVVLSCFFNHVGHLTECTQGFKRMSKQTIFMPQKPDGSISEKNTFCHVWEVMCTEQIQALREMMLLASRIVNKHGIHCKKKL